MTLLGIPPGAASVESLTEAEIPPAALWIKDLVMWGTLEPVAAYLLARRVADARPDAEALARGYYSGVDVGEVGDPLDPGAIRAWAATVQEPPSRDRVRALASRIEVQLNPRVANAPSFGRWRVVPNIRDTQVDWLDVAGYLLAESGVPEGWTERAVHDYDFVLNPAERVVQATAYL
jgi:hypothetical protein